MRHDTRQRPHCGSLLTRLFADVNLLRGQKIGIVQAREFHVAASRLSECADQEIDLTRARGFVEAVIQECASVRYLL